MGMVLFSLIAGHSTPCIFVLRCTRTMCKPFVRINIQSGGAPIGVIRIGRVHIARRGAAPHVARAAAVSRPTEAVLRTCSLQPIFFFIVTFFRCSPRSNQTHYSID